MFDLIIPVYKPDEKFYKLLSALGKQSMPPKKVILMLTVSDISGHERDELSKKTRKILDEVGLSEVRAEVYPVEKSEFYHGRTRNKGIAFSDADKFLLMTMDAIPDDPNLFETMVNDLDNGKMVSQVYARQATSESAPEYLKYTQSFNYPKQKLFKNKSDLETLGIKTIFCSDVCCMYKRDIFDSLGRFPEKVNFNEDMIFARKAINAGYTICYDGFVSVTHFHKYGLIAQFKRNRLIAISQKENSDTFGDLSSTSEGKKMVMTILKRLRAEGHYLQMIYYFFLSAAKYLGFLVGKLF